MGNKVRSPPSTWMLLLMASAVRKVIAFLTSCTPDQALLVKGGRGDTVGSLDQHQKEQYEKEVPRGSGTEEGFVAVGLESP